MRPTVQFLDLLASPQTRLHERVDEMCKGGEGIYKNGEVSEETKDVADDKRRAGHPRQTVFMAVHRQSFETRAVSSTLTLTFEQVSSKFERVQASFDSGVRIP